MKDYLCSPKDTLDEIKKDRGRVIEDLLFLIEIVVKKYYYLDKDLLDDLCQEGRIGLIKAVDSFSDEYGANIQTYAKICILSKIRDFLRKNSSKIVNMSPQKIHDAFKLKKFIDKYKSENSGHEPLSLDISKETGFDEKKIEELLLILKYILYNSNNQDTEIDTLNDTSIANDFLLPSITKEIDNLSDEEKHIFKKKYFENKSYRTIGFEMNMSHETIRKKHNKAIFSIKQKTKK